MTDWSAVTSAIAEAERTGATLGVAIDAPGGAQFSHNGARRFVAASTIKIAIMIELFRRIDDGAYTLDTPHTLRAEDRAGGSGIIVNLHDGIVLTLADLAYLMMSISDNTATNILIDRTGMAEVNATMHQLGMTSSALGRKMLGRPVQDPALENYAVPEEFALAVRALLENRAASPASCARMVALLEKQQNDRRIARHLPRENRPRWGSKTGSLPGVCSDAGFIVTPRGPLVIAVFVANTPDPLAGEAMIGAVAQAALKQNG